MKVPFAYPPYGNAFKYASAVEGLFIDKGLRVGPASRGDNPQAPDVLAGVVTLQRARKENRRILLLQIRAVALLILGTQCSRVRPINAIDRPQHRKLRSSVMLPS